MIDPADLPTAAFLHQEAYRLVNGKYPPIHLFDDVADQADFEALYAVQALTNPRIQMQVGELHRVPPARRPWGIPGCNYALGPFVHLSPYGSRFSDGEYGVFYCAEQMATAIAETRYHQERYFRAVQGLKFDRIVMRGLKVCFSARLRNIHDPRRDDEDWYHPEDYGSARRLGRARSHKAGSHKPAFLTKLPNSKNMSDPLPIPDVLVMRGRRHRFNQMR